MLYRKNIEPPPPPPPDDMLDLSKLLHLMSGEERGTVEVKCLVQEHNTDPSQGSNPESSDSITIF